MLAAAEPKASPKAPTSKNDEAALRALVDCDIPSSSEASGSREDPQLAEMEKFVRETMDKGVSKIAEQVATKVKINWSTHRKEGMRLDRMVNSNAESFPHMAKLWNGSNKDPNQISHADC